MSEDYVLEQQRELQQQQQEQRRADEERAEELAESDRPVELIASTRQADESALTTMEDKIREEQYPEAGREAEQDMGEEGARQLREELDSEARTEDDRASQLREELESDDDRRLADIMQRDVQEQEQQADRHQASSGNFGNAGQQERQE